MIVNTHLLISQILYKYISSQTNFELDRLAFTYGNIKPDFNNKDINRSHTLDDSLEIINKYSEELMSQNILLSDVYRILTILTLKGNNYLVILINDKSTIISQCRMNFQQNITIGEV